MENSSDQCVQILAWDSEFFGYKVGRILPPRLTSEELRRVLALLKNENVTLVYWPSDPDDPQSQDAAREIGGFLADRKTTYVINLETIRERLVKEPSIGIKEYDRMETTDELDELAIQSGVYSRYNVDPKIGKENFEKMYKIWILKSVNRALAEKVFVSMKGDKVAGMVTVGLKNGRGEIGLIAVHESMRGRNVGVNLIRAAQEWAVGKGCRFAQVVTQGDNPAACRLYEKSGYHVESIVNFYHFWI